MYVITIARGFGSGGKAIGEAVAENLGIPCYEDEIKQMAVVESGLNEELFDETDEKYIGSAVQRKLHTFIHRYTPKPEQAKFASQEHLFEIQTKIIRSLVKKESCVIIGKCADDVLREYKNTVSIYIEAPRSACVKSIKEKLHVSTERANQLIYQTDKYRSKYYSYYTGGKKWNNPINYDLVLNSDRIGRDKCVQVIIEYLKIRFGPAVVDPGKTTDAAAPL